MREHAKAAATVWNEGGSEAGRRARRALWACALAAAGCSAAPPPPPPTPPAPPPAQPEAPTPAEKEPVDAGNECIKATAECGGGVCSVAVKNTCEQAATCNVAIVTTCQSGTAMVEAAGRGRDTFAGNSEGQLNVKAACNEGEVRHTAVKSMSCK